MVEPIKKLGGHLVSPKTLPHSKKLRLAAMMMLVRSSSLQSSWKRSGPPDEQLMGKLAGPVQNLVRLEGNNHIDGGEKPHHLAIMLDGLDAIGRGDMGLAHELPTDQLNVAGAVDELAEVELADHGLVHLAGGKIEAGEVPVDRKARCLGLVG